MILPSEHQPRPFIFERDTFAFANELLWEYHIEPATGAMRTRRNEPPPAYALRCFVLARSTRQFFYHARFDPGSPVADAETFRKRIRKVVSCSPRRPSAEAARIVIPGYDCLRSFSAAQEPLLKAECGGAWQSYVVRSHWRMVFPVSRAHQERTARQLVLALDEHRSPIVHLVRFPQLTINHCIVLFDVAQGDAGLRFLAGDPNQPARPVELNYSRHDRTFYFPRNHYWAGGKLNVIEIYRNLLY